MNEATNGIPREALQRVVRRSLKDEEFRQRVLADPKAALEDETGTRLPEELDLRCVEGTPDTAYLVLPKLQDPTESEEPSENGIEAAVGGYLLDVCCVDSV
ncbi:MAG: NHLP leader peptide family RiPP precursor [Rubrobacteraceae bacterium]